jgi:hypothetical protein
MEMTFPHAALRQGPVTGRMSYNAMLAAATNRRGQQTMTNKAA